MKVILFLSALLISNLAHASAQNFKEKMSDIRGLHLNLEGIEKNSQTKRLKSYLGCAAVEITSSQICFQEMKKKNCFDLSWKNGITSRFDSDSTSIVKRFTGITKVNKYKTEKINGSNGLQQKREEIELVFRDQEILSIKVNSKILDVLNSKFAMKKVNRSQEIYCDRG